MASLMRLSTVVKQEPAASTLLLKALRAIPPFKGKSRIARGLLSSTKRNQATLIRDHYGNQMVVPNLVEPVGFSLGIDGSYEPDVVDLLRTHLSGDRDFLDVGANIGAFTVALAGSARRVIAIEASPAVLPYLKRNVDLSGRSNVNVVDCAVSAPGMDQVPFYVPPMDHFGMGSSAAQFDVAPVMIPARPLDQILQDCGGARVGAVKVDVEGFEAHVFLGATELLGSACPPVVVFEFCDWAEERAFPGHRGWAQQIMLDAGYDLWLLADLQNGLPPLGAPVTEGFHTIVGIARNQDRSQMKRGF
jgi:FkbM family methyltransferase